MKNIIQQIVEKTGRRRTVLAMVAETSLKKQLLAALLWAGLWRCQLKIQLQKPPQRFSVPPVPSDLKITDMRVAVTG